MASLGREGEAFGHDDRSELGQVHHARTLTGRGGLDVAEVEDGPCTHVYTCLCLPIHRSLETTRWTPRM